MEVRIQIMKPKKIKSEKEINPGVRKAVQSAMNELKGVKHRCFVEFYVYIDGDPISQKIIYLN